MKNKKDSIRKHLLKKLDGYKFTSASLAGYLGEDITQKDIGNVTRELLKSGGLARVRENGEFVYTVNHNAIVVHFAKNPIRDLPPRPGRQAKPKPEGGFFGSPLPTRQRNRPPMVRAIDNEIAMHKGKIKKLEMWRKEYMT